MSIPKVHLPEVSLPHTSIAPNILQAIAIIFLIFIFVLVLAYMSHNFMEWSLSGFGIGFFIGFVLAIVLEGFLLVGGRTVITGLLNWKHAPAPVQNVLTTGHQKLLDALNVPASCSGIVK